MGNGCAAPATLAYHGPSQIQEPSDVDVVSGVHGGWHDHGYVLADHVPFVVPEHGQRLGVHALDYAQAGQRVADDKYSHVLPADVEGVGVLKQHHLHQGTRPVGEPLQ